MIANAKAMLANAKALRLPLEARTSSGSQKAWLVLFVPTDLELRFGNHRCEHEYSCSMSTHVGGE